MRATNATSEKKSTKKRQRQMAKKKRKKKFSSKGEKKSTDVGVYKIRKVTKFGNMKKRRDKILEKSQNVFKQGENQNPGDTNQNLELGKKLNKRKMN